MPAGLGWHPFFNRTLTSQSEQVSLCFHSEGVYPDENNNRIPSGPPRPPTSEQDFSVERALPSGRFFDICYQGYDGNGYITWPESKIKLGFECSAACSHLVLYSPVGRAYFALEPVTHATNGVNLYALGETGSGIVTLKPNERLEASFTMTVNFV